MTRITHGVTRHGVPRGVGNDGKLTTMTTVSLTHEGDGEHMVPLGGDGAAAVLEGRVCGRTTADDRKTKKE